MQKILIVLVTIVVVLMIVRVSIGLFSASRIATGLVTADNQASYLAGCDGLHNCTSSTAKTKRNLIEPITYASDSQQVIEGIAAVIAAQSGATVITKSKDYLHATYKTLLMGYTDDLEVLLDQTNAVVHIRSASRIGKSDLGANRKRIDALRELLKGKI